MKHCVCGGLAYSRSRAGPTSRRKLWMILIERCGRCQRIYAVKPYKLSWHERRWIKRWNASVDRNRKKLAFTEIRWGS